MRSVGVSDIGKVRTENQDTIFYSDLPIGQLDNLYIVADGMGGHQAGGYASLFSMESFVEFVRKTAAVDPVELMRRCILRVNDEVLKRCEEPGHEGMGTTFVAATVTDKDILFMNIGDSRGYFIDDNIEQITVDHSYVEELVQAGQINREETKKHPNKNLITRAVGIFGVEPDFFRIPRKAGYLLLCSDGLTNMVDDDEIKEVFMEQGTLEEKVQKLVDRANDYGGRDNISLLAVQVETRGEGTC